MNILDIITKKKNKEELTYDELSYAFLGYLNKEIPDYQMSSLLMAITINGMKLEETTNLTDIFVKSGEVYEFDKEVCDKHSTGGIGDTVSLIIAPILASLNIPICKMSGRGLGITGGTIDKLESIPGYNINLTKEDYYNNLEKCNIALGAQTENLVPLDKVIYALRDVTGTTESIPLITSSIISKKIASGAKYILIDVKCGEGALMKTKEEATILGEWLTKVGEHFGRKITTLITEMDEPLSMCIGNALEVEEAIEVLKGKECKLKEVSVEVASTLISQYQKIEIDLAKQKAEEVLLNHKAYEAFEKWIQTQGGRLNELKLSPYVLELKANTSGTISNISALKAGKLSLKLGAGRQDKTSKIDYGVGIKLLKQKGEKVEKGETIAKLYVKKDYSNIKPEDLKLFKIK